MWNHYRMWRAKEVGWLLKHNEVAIVFDGSYEPSDMTFVARTLKEAYRKAHKYIDASEVGYRIHDFIMVLDWEWQK